MNLLSRVLLLTYYNCIYSKTKKLYMDKLLALLFAIYLAYIFLFEVTSTIPYHTSILGPVGRFLVGSSRHYIFISDTARVIQKCKLVRLLKKTTKNS